MAVPIESLHALQSWLMTPPVTEMTHRIAHRIATRADVPAIAALMDRAIRINQAAFLTPQQLAASGLSMGLDTQLIDDGTYFLIERGGVPAGCGGWSFRATLYGGNHATELRNDRRLDPANEPARVRAMYTDPAFVRQGVGRYILSLCEAAARAAGFARVELMSTLSGEPLYLACGYEPVERVAAMAAEGEPVPGVRMGKGLV